MTVPTPEPTAPADRIAFGVAATLAAPPAGQVVDRIESAPE